MMKKSTNRWWSLVNKPRCGSARPANVSNRGETNYLSRQESVINKGVAGIALQGAAVGGDW